MRIERLTAERAEQMWALLDVFADAFDDPEHYSSARSKATRRSAACALTS